LKVLVIAAHPDDEVLGMGGTIKKYTKNGHNVKVIFMATGIFARRKDNYKNSSKYIINKKIRKSMEAEMLHLRKDASNAAKIMGIKNIEFLNFPDNEMDKVSNLEITKKIESIIEDFVPDIVYTHSQHDVNIDHRIIYNATITATRPTTKYKIAEVISYEVPSSTEWYFPSKFSPNVFVDISAELPIKIKALMAYKHEIRKFPHPRSVEALDVIAKRWGTVSGFTAAEAFQLIRHLKNKV
jgi:LmbE family N-acetylglucosaminyl deacetylase